MSDSTEQSYPQVRKNIEPPSYNRSVTLEAHASPVGMSHALSGTAQNHLQLAGIGAQLSQSSSDEMARLVAENSAKKPGGQTLIPAFTQSDRAFLDTYKREEFANLSIEAERLINANKLEALKNPSPSTLAAFQKNTREGLMQLASNASDLNKTNLSREFMRAYESSFYQVAGATEQANQAYLKDLSDTRFDQTQRDVKNLQLQGLDESAQDVVSRTKEDIDGQVADGLITQREASNRKLALEMQSLSDRQSWEFQEAERNGMGDEYLKWLSDEREGEFKLKDGEGFSKKEVDPVSRIEANQATLSFANRYRAMTRNQQQNDFIQAQIDLGQGTMTESLMQNYQEKLDQTDFLKLKFMAAQQQAVQNAANIKFIEIDRNKDNIDAMIRYSSKEVDGYIDQRFSQTEASLGRPLSLTEQAQIVEQIRAPAPGFSGRLKTLIKEGSGEQAIAAMNAYRMLSNNNHIAVSGVSDSLDPIAAVYDSLIPAVSPQEAFNIALKRLGPIDQKTYEELQNNYNHLSGASGSNWNDPVTLKKDVAKSMGYAPAMLPAGVATRFRSLHEAYYIQTQDWDVAQKMASDKLNRVYGETNINGTKEVMYGAPEKFIPYAENNVVWVRNQMIDSSEAIFMHQKSAFNEGNASYYFEFPAGALHDVSDPIIEPRYDAHYFSEDSIEVMKVMADGERPSGKLVMLSDNATLIPEQGGIPSYGLYFQGENGPEPIWNPASSNFSRFEPNMQSYIKNVDVPEDRIKQFLLDYDTRKLREQNYKVMLQGTIGAGL